MKTSQYIPLLIAVSIATVCSSCAHADTANTPGQYHVQSLDPNIDVSSLAAPGVVVHQAKAPRQDPGDLLPSTETRDKAFKKAGFNDELADWDQLDRDQLYLRARHMNEDRVLTYYPNLPKKKLIALIEILHAEMRQETVSK